MARKRKKERKVVSKPKIKEERKNKNYLLWSLIILPIVLFIFGTGYYLGYQSALNQSKVTTIEKIEEEEEEKTPNQTILDTKKRLELLQDIELVEVVETTAVIKQKRIETVEKQDPLEEEKNITINNNQKQEELHNTVKQYNSASHEFDNKLTIPPKNIEREIKIVESKPKLAIIIDDVSTKSHVKVIKSLNIPITMSFLPPSRARPHSAKLAAKEDFYMVHLPMEAKNFTAEEPLTLRVDDSQSKISSRIIELKKLFPKVQYINNHTGSKFTSDEKAMNRLIYSLNKNKINFIDSRTTAQTKAPQVLENFGKKYIARDIFLDHKNEKEYILAQIKRAIKIAKKHGSAIAIGHPHAKTMLALHHSKQLFKGIELVYIDKIE